METFQGGDLYQMQQEAIKRARETAQKSTVRTESSAKKPVLSHIGSDEMLLIAVLAVLLLNGCNDTLLILALACMLIL